MVHTRSAQLLGPEPRPRLDDRNGGRAPQSAFLANADAVSIVTPHIVSRGVPSATAMGSNAQQPRAGPASPGGTARIGRERHSGQVERAAIETARRLARRLERR